jgi:hypothetical protein
MGTQRAPLPLTDACRRRRGNRGILPGVHGASSAIICFSTFTRSTSIQLVQAIEKRAGLLPRGHVRADPVCAEPSAEVTFGLGRA